MTTAPERLAARAHKPWVGAMVHMIDYDEEQPCRAAIVEATDYPQSHRVTLKVLRPHGDRVEYHVDHVELDQETVRPLTWHWPEDA